MRGPRTVWCLLGASVVATSLLLLGPRGSLRQVIVLVVALALFGGLFTRWTSRDTLTVDVALLASSVLLVVAVAAEPFGNDLWYYQMYGRIAVEHHDNPYEHSPGEYAGDPVLPRTGGLWDDVHAEYGPAFVAVAAAIATVTGTSALAARLAWQGLAAGAVLVALVLIGRRTRSGAAVALVGMNPVVLVAVVNAGHNDALVGLAVLASILLCLRGRDLAAVLLLTAAMLVKVPAGFGLVAMLAWLAVHRGAKPAARLALAAAALSVVAVLAAGGTAVLRPMLGARSRAGSTTAWNLLRENGLTRFWGRLDPLGEVSDIVPVAALVTAVLLAAAIVIIRMRDEEPTLAVTFAMVAWLLTANYTPPWYVAWVLPALALRHRSRVTTVVVALNALFLLSTFVDDHALASVFQTMRVPIYEMSAHLHGAAMVAGLVALAVLVDAARRPRLPEALPADSSSTRQSSSPE